METIYKLSEIKPIGNFDSILEMLDGKLKEMEKEGYSKRVPNFIKLVVAELGLLDIFEEGLSAPVHNGWNKEEEKICLLFTNLLIIRANNIAQTYFNKIEMDENHIQLMDRANNDAKYKKIFGELIINKD
jgi:hypothetical protein